MSKKGERALREGERDERAWERVRGDSCVCRRIQVVVTGQGWCEWKGMRSMMAGCSFMIMSL
ncbi:hypothetical protein [Bartonella schoenbuchensis]|uniref:hypothetical protein n=1 Tax=Bartonella schoenbuchensis TaxID=165694 RepID=UPI0031453CB9